MESVDQAVRVQAQSSPESGQDLVSLETSSYGVLPITSKLIPESPDSFARPVWRLAWPN